MSFFKRAGSDSDSSSSDESEEELLQSSDDESGSGSDAGLKATAAAGTKGGKPAVKSKASRFLKGAASSDSSDESDSDASDADSDAADSDAPKKKKGASKFLKGSKSDASSDEDGSDDDSDQETVKIVKSAKTKRNDEMEGCEKAITNAQRIGDWASVNSGECLHRSAGLPMRS